MKKTFIIAALLFMHVLGFCQTYRMIQTKNYHNQLRLNTVTGEVMQIQDDGQKWWIVVDIEPTGDYTNRFQLFETQNMWNFILLDSFTGKLWQVQFSVKGTDYMGFWPINGIPLARSTNRSIFTIQPMISMFQYYLINNDTGEMWKFQWSTKGDNYRWIEKM